MTRLDKAFFERDTVKVACDLLGRLLVHEVDGQRIVGRIVETEAYTGWEDQASHAYGGMTPRNAVMYGPVGLSYLYFIYGKYWLLNVISKPLEVDYPAAILIRALEPVEGLEIMAARRPGRSSIQWTNGPGRLVLALGVDSGLNGVDMTHLTSPLYFEQGEPVAPNNIRSGPRIGLGRVPEPWKSHPWRFWIDGNSFVSK